MTSAKKSSPRLCRKCHILLTDENWKLYDKNHSSYICYDCRKIKDKAWQKADEKYGQKQKNRYRRYRSAVIMFYGNKCAQCYEDKFEVLTIDHINGNGSKHRKEISNHITDFLYNNPLMDGYQVLCYNCNCSKNVVYKDKYALRDKKKVMAAYGDKCEECSEDRIERLTIDHKNNDGAEQRRQLKCKTGSIFYRWLIRNNFPSNLGLQVLCYNCNCSKRSNRSLSADADGF